MDEFVYPTNRFRWLERRNFLEEMEKVLQQLWNNEPYGLSDGVWKDVPVVTE